MVGFPKELKDSEGGPGRDITLPSGLKGLKRSCRLRHLRSDEHFFAFETLEFKTTLKTIQHLLNASEKVPDPLPKTLFCFIFSVKPDD